MYISMTVWKEAIPSVVKTGTIHISAGAHETTPATIQFQGGDQNALFTLEKAC